MQEITNTYINKENVAFAKTQTDVCSKYSVQISLIPPGFSRTDKLKDISNRENEISGKKILNPYAIEFKPIEKEQLNQQKSQSIVKSGDLVVRKINLAETKEEKVEINQSNIQQEQTKEQQEAQKKWNLKAPSFEPVTKKQVSLVTMVNWKHIWTLMQMQEL